MSWKIFGGLCPKCNERSLPEIASQTCTNAWLAERDLSPIKNPLTITTVASGTQTIFLWRRGGSTEWLSWLTDVNVVKGPISGDDYDRIYYTDGTTLHEKLWSGSATVSISDVSFTKPSAPTIAKTLLFNPANIECVYGPQHQNISLTMSGWKWEGNALVVTYRFPRTAVPSTFQYLYRFKIATNPDVSTPVYLPLLDSSTQETSYSETVTLYYGSTPTKWATLTLGTIEDKNFEQNTPYNDAGVYWVAHDTVVTFMLEPSRNSKQYQYYVQTLVDSYGHESPPSDVSDEVEWEINDKLTITTGTGTCPDGTAASKVRIYRSATGKDDSDFFFVAEVTPGATYVDMLNDAALAEVMPLIENPPTAMTGLVSMPG